MMVSIYMICIQAYRQTQQNTTTTVFLYFIQCLPHTKKNNAKHFFVHSNNTGINILLFLLKFPILNN